MKTFIETLAEYDFRDPQGHSLLMCADFTDFVQLQDKRLDALKTLWRLLDGRVERPLTGLEKAIFRTIHDAIDDGAFTFSPNDNMTSVNGEILTDVLEERARQDCKWGEQNHDDFVWSAILGEEAGEVAQAALHDEFGGKAAGTVRAELVQLAAVGLAWIACIDRRKARDLSAVVSMVPITAPELAPWILASDRLPDVCNDFEDEEGQSFQASDEVLIRYAHPAGERLPAVAPAFGYMVALANLVGDEKPGGAEKWLDSETGRVYEKVVAWMPVPPLEVESC